VLVPIEGWGRGQLHFNLRHWRVYRSRTSRAISVCDDLGGEPLASSLQLAHGWILCSVSLPWKDTFNPVVNAQGFLWSSSVCFWVSWGMLTYLTLCKLFLRALNTQPVLYTPSLLFYLSWFFSSTKHEQEVDFSNACSLLKLRPKWTKWIVGSTSHRLIFIPIFFAFNDV